MSARDGLDVGSSRHLLTRWKGMSREANFSSVSIILRIKGCGDMWRCSAWVRVPGLGEKCLMESPFRPWFPSPDAAAAAADQWAARAGVRFAAELLAPGSES